MGSGEVEIVGGPGACCLLLQVCDDDAHDGLAYFLVVLAVLDRSSSYGTARLRGGRRFAVSGSVPVAVLFQGTGTQEASGEAPASCRRAHAADVVPLGLGNRMTSHRHRAKKAAEKRAKEIVENTGGGRGEVRSQKLNGQWGDSDSGSKNESPAKDRKH
jgi:hypothetical protein